MYFNPVLKGKFGYSSEDVIMHNFWLAFPTIFMDVGWVLMSRYVYPLKLMKVRGFMALTLMMLIPLLLTLSTSPIHIFLMQVSILALHLGTIPGDAIFIKRFPVYKRFTATTFVYALTRAMMYVIVSFGVVYLTEWFGYAGILLLTVPSCIGFLAGVYYFEKLDRHIEAQTFTMARAA